jgi:hypothetical protein
MISSLEHSFRKAGTKRRLLEGPFYSRRRKKMKALAWIDGLRDFVDAYNFAKRLKTLRGLTHTSSSAKPGLPTHEDSKSARTRKCRD